jgi:hypothetical protein
MKREVLQFEVTRVKTRKHRVLFDNELPFKPKSEKSKMAYQRKPKHLAKGWE